MTVRKLDGSDWLVLCQEGDIVEGTGGGALTRRVMEKFIERAQNRKGTCPVPYGGVMRRTNETFNAFFSRFLKIDLEHSCAVLQHICGQYVDGKFSIVAHFLKDVSYINLVDEAITKNDGVPPLKIRAAAGGDKDIREIVTWDLIPFHPLLGNQSVDTSL